jgi:hypothetical protein
MQKMGPNVLVSTVAPIFFTASTPACSFDFGASPVRLMRRINTFAAPAVPLHVSTVPIVPAVMVALPPSASSSAGVASAHALPCPKAARNLRQGWMRGSLHGCACSWGLLEGGCFVGSSHPTLA